MARKKWPGFSLKRISFSCINISYSIQETWNGLKIIKLLEQRIIIDKKT